MTALHSVVVGQHETIEQRSCRVLAVHFDPDEGTPYWLDRAADLGFDPRQDVRCVADLQQFGTMTTAELQQRPLLDYVPRSLHNRHERLILGQTGGATGPGTWTAYLDDEFIEAFVTPFAVAARHVSFPRGEAWLYAGPSGPHIIGKVVAHLARAVGSVEPFSVDLDPRWARKLAEGSFARKRYLKHVVEQAMAVIDTQAIGVLFTTPPILHALAQVMSERQRLAIRGVHYGGVALAPSDLQQFQTEAFPRAVHLSGYGNTLFGCCLELNNRPGRTLDYFPFGNRLVFEVFTEAHEPAGKGERGRLAVTRLDESMLIVRLLERDVAALVDPPRDAPTGFQCPGVRDPGPVQTTATTISTNGLY